MTSGFPQGPFRLQRRYVNSLRRGTAGLVLVSGLVLALFGYVGAGEVPGIRHDTRVWAAGGPELPADVTGTVTSRQFIFKSYDLTVSYRLPDGTVRSAPLRFASLFAADDDPEPVVRLSPADPNDFALRQAVDATGGRWASTAVYVVFGAIMVTIFLLEARKPYRKLRFAEEAARVGEPSAATVFSFGTKLVNGRATGRNELTFALPNPASLEITCELESKDGPLAMLDEKRTLVLVPREHPQAALPLHEDLYPLELTENQLAAARAFIAGAKSTLSGKVPAAAPSA